MKTRQCCFNMLTELVNVLPGALTQHIPVLVPGERHLGRVGRGARVSNLLSSCRHHLLLERQIQQLQPEDRRLGVSPCRHGDAPRPRLPRSRPRPGPARGGLRGRPLLQDHLGGPARHAAAGEGGRSLLNSCPQAPPTRPSPPTGDPSSGQPIGERGQLRPLPLHQRPLLLHHQTAEGRRHRPGSEGASHFLHGPDHL